MKKTVFILPLMVLTSALASCSIYHYKYEVEYDGTSKLYRFNSFTTYSKNKGFKFTYKYTNDHPMKYFWYYDNSNAKYFTLTTDDDNSFDFKIEGVENSKGNALDYDINNSYLVLKSEANENVVIKFRTYISIKSILAYASDSMPS